MTYTNRALVLAFITAIMSGFAVFINKFGITNWHDSDVYTTAKNIIATFFLGVCVMAWVARKDIVALTRKQFCKLALIGIIGGSVPFVLFFKGLSMIPATQAAFIHKTLFVWVALLAIIFLKEKLTIVQWLGIGVMMAGVVLLGGPQAWSWGMGMWLVLGATLLWSVETIVAKQVLRDVPALIVGCARMGIGAGILLVYLMIVGKIGTLVPTTWEQVGWVVITGMILFGYVATWYAALKRLPATVASTILVLAFPVTVVLQNISSGMWTGTGVLYLVLFLIGIGLFIRCGIATSPQPSPSKGEGVLL